MVFGGVANEMPYPDTTVASAFKFGYWQINCSFRQYTENCMEY